MDKHEKRKRWKQRVNKGLMTVLCNYAAIAAGAAIFQKEATAYLSFFTSIVCIFVIASVYED